ncbi:MAG TPA: pyrroline-5-carboxylate reductase [Anaerolineales bacterium]|nr:pyrroline-5-carboxylate reductase [Anaerolineales bacterium]
MTEHRRIVFVGPGVMAEAIVGGLIQRAGLQPSAIVVAGPRSERLEELSKRHGVGTESDSRRAMAGASTVVLSIKPQTLDEVMRQLHGAVPPEALVLSIVAGARLLDLTRGLAHSAVVRSMPNTPAQVGEGVTVWTATPETTAAQRDDAKSILTSCGQEIFVENEDYLDMATALSGTGPAYVFLFMEAMVDAGVHLGFPRRIAEALVVQTVRGSVAFYESSPVHLARLRNQVTSPGGTSAAALYYLEKAGFRTALSRAIWAAYERSIQLGQGRKRGSIDEGA